MKRLIFYTVLLASVTSRAALHIQEIGIYGPDRGIVTVELKIEVRRQLKTYIIKTTSEELELYNNESKGFIFRSIEQIKQDNM